MKLTLQGISERTQWEEKGYQLPQYDINKMKKSNKRGTITGFILVLEICFVLFMRVWYRIC